MPKPLPATVNVGVASVAKMLPMPFDGEPTNGIDEDHPFERMKASRRTANPSTKKGENPSKAKGDPEMTKRKFSSEEMETIFQERREAEKERERNEAEAALEAQRLVRLEAKRARQRAADAKRRLSNSSIVLRLPKGDAVTIRAAFEAHEGNATEAIGKFLVEVALTSRSGGTPMVAWLEKFAVHVAAKREGGGGQ